MARRRYRLLLSALLVAAILLFVQTRIEAMMPALYSAAESRIERLLGDRVDVTIGTVTGGIFQPFVMRDINLVDKKSRKIQMPFVKIENINTGFCVWTALFEKEMLRHPVKAALKCPIDVNISSRDALSSAFVRLSETSDGVNVIGRLNLIDRGKVDFHGKVTFSGSGRIGFDVEAKPGRGSLKARGEIIDQNTLVANFKASHLGGGKLDIVCDGLAELKYKKTEKSGAAVFEVRVETMNTILNHRPFRDMRLFAVIKRYKETIVEVSSFEMDKTFRAHGRVYPNRPSCPMDVVVVADNLNITPLLLDLKVSHPEITFLSGIANAKFRLKGPFNYPDTEGRLEIRNGNLGEICFETMAASLKGEGPLITIKDARINKENGYIVLSGDFDLRRIGKNDCLKDVNITMDEENLVWEGWKIVKESKNYKVRMTKPVSDAMSVGFNTFINDDKIDERQKTSAVELEYKLYQKDSMTVRMGQDSDFVGLEHKEKF